jgi:uncharacterized protein (DUF302 family)
MIEQTTYGIATDTDLGPDAAETAIVSALAEEGFGILTEIDVAATLKAKLDVDRPAYKILGACNPALANRALAVDEHIGLLLPCNVIVYAAGDGSRIEVLEPQVMVAVAGEEIAPIAAEARERLVRALENVANLN